MADLQTSFWAWKVSFALSFMAESYSTQCNKIRDEFIASVLPCHADLLKEGNNYVSFLPTDLLESCWSLFEQIWHQLGQCLAGALRHGLASCDLWQNKRCDFSSHFLFNMLSLPLIYEASNSFSLIYLTKCLRLHILLQFAEWTLGNMQQIKGPRTHTELLRSSLVSFNGCQT